jgi:ABC-type uncharacterized transport system ATPase subunit
MAKLSLLELAMEQTKANVVKSKGGSGKTTYLDRFVQTLLDADGNPIEPKERVQIIAEISLDIAVETIENLDLTTEEHKEEFAAINKKVKPMVNAAISDSNNSTSLSYNENYKDVWKVKKEGKLISLVPVDKE